MVTSSGWPQGLEIIYTYRPSEDTLDFEDPKETFRLKPLKNKTFIESFSGDPAEGGARLSSCWERAGGKSVRRDVKINKDHDFLRDDEYWKSFERAPPYAGHFAVECTTFSIAHTTPVIRTLENPVGDQNNADIHHANRLASKVVDRCLLLLEAGSHILVENPWLSYLWLLPEMLVLLGIPGLHLVRIDQCTCGTPFK